MKHWILLWIVIKVQSLLQSKKALYIAGTVQHPDNLYSIWNTEIKNHLPTKRKA